MNFVSKSNIRIFYAYNMYSMGRKKSKANKKGAVARAKKR